MIYSDSNKAFSYPQFYVIKGSESPVVKLSYEKSNHKIEKYVEMINIFLILVFAFTLMCPLIYILFVHYARGLETDDYSLLSPVW